MSMTDRDSTVAGLAEVLTEHLPSLSKLGCDCGHWPYTKGSGFFSAQHRDHVAAVVLAHLEAQGWAQGREKFGCEFQSKLGRWVEPYPSRTVAEREVEQAQGSVRLMRRFEAAPTEWEPVEAADG